MHSVLGYIVAWGAVIERDLCLHMGTGIPTSGDLDMHNGREQKIMEIRQLEMLITVVERKGYLHAGEHLHISHSAIHRQIRLLEEELRDKVFVREGRTVHLTEAGKLLFDLASKITREVTAVKQQVKDQQRLFNGNLRIGTGTTALVFFSHRF